MKFLTYRRFTSVAFASMIAWTVSTSGEEFALPLDQPVAEGVPGPGAGVIESSTATDLFTISGTAGQNVFLEEVSASASFKGWLQWEIKSPTGKSVLRAYLDGNQEGRRTLPETGTYTVRVWVGANNPDYTGTYSFVIRSIPPDSTFPIQIGDTVSVGLPAAGAGRIEVPGARDIYSFAAAAGDMVLMEELNVAKEFKGWLYWELHSPADQVMTGSYFEGNSNEGRKTLPEAGTYQLHVYARANDPAYVGDYSFRLRPVPRDQSFNINLGDTVSEGVPGPGAGRIEATGSEDLYTFSATAGQSVFFDSLSADPAFNGWLQWQLRSPSGQLVFSAYIGNSTVGRRTLPETGLYTLRLSAGATDPSYVGAYSFRLTSADSNVPMTLRLGDTVREGAPAPGAGTIEVAGAEDTYVFEGKEGQSVIFQPLSVGASLGGWLRWQVKAPSGADLVTDFLKTDRMERRKLTETGPYTIRVFVGANNAEYIGAYSFRAYAEVFANPDTFATAPGRPLSIPESKLLCNDQWHASDTVSIQLPSAATVEGGSVTQSATGVVYTPKTGFSGTDRFEYVLMGEYGGQSAATATVHVYEGGDRNPMVVSVLGRGGSTARVCLLGEPGRTYEVERSDKLFGWSKAGTVTADQNGSMDFEYSPETAGMGFYRFVRQTSAAAD